jgi:hypothetical protein
LQIIGVDLPGGDSVGSAIMKATRVPFSHPFAFLSHPRLLLALGLLALSGAPIISAASAESLPRAIAKTFTERAKLIPPLNDSYTKFGNAVSLSGNRALIGAYLGGDQVGHAYIFVFDGTTWTLEADLAPSDGTAGDLFGYRVSLSGDRALVGAEGHGDSGAAYVFAFDPTYRMNGGTSGGLTDHQILTASVDKFVSYNGKWLEIYEKDVVNLPRAISYAHGRIGQ